MIRPRIPWPLGRGADPRPVRAADPARDELLDRSARVLDAEGRVAGAGQGPHAVDDDLEHAVDGEHPGHRPDRLVEGLQPGHRAGDLLAAAGAPRVHARRRARRRRRAPSGRRARPSRPFRRRPRLRARTGRAGEAPSRPRTGDRDRVAGPATPSRRRSPCRARGSPRRGSPAPRTTRRAPRGRGRGDGAAGRARSPTPRGSRAHRGAPRGRATEGTPGSSPPSVAGPGSRRTRPGHMRMCVHPAGRPAADGPNVTPGSGRTSYHPAPWTRRRRRAPLRLLRPSRRPSPAGSTPRSPAAGSSAGPPWPAAASSRSPWRRARPLRPPPGRMPPRSPRRPRRRRRRPPARPPPRPRCRG